MIYSLQWKTKGITYLRFYNTTCKHIFPLSLFATLVHFFSWMPCRLINWLQRVADSLSHAKIISNMLIAIKKRPEANALVSNH